MKCQICENYFSVGSVRFENLPKGNKVLRVCPDCYKKERGLNVS